MNKYKFIRVNNKEEADKAIQYFVEKFDATPDDHCSDTVKYKEGMEVLGLDPQDNRYFFSTVEGGDWESPKDEEHFLPEEYFLAKEYFLPKEYTIKNAFCIVNNEEEFNAAVAFFKSEGGIVEQAYCLLQAEYGSNTKNVMVNPDGIIYAGSWTADRFSEKYTEYILTTKTFYTFEKSEKKYEVDGKLLTKANVEAKIQELEKLIKGD